MVQLLLFTSQVFSPTGVSDYIFALRLSMDLTGCLHVSFYDLLLIVPFGILAVWLKTLVTNLRIDHSV